jgi:hypothetical protein
MEHPRSSCCDFLIEFFRDTDEVDGVRTTRVIPLCMRCGLECVPVTAADYKQAAGGDDEN